MCHRAGALVIACLATLALSSVASAGPVKVELHGGADGWELLRDGKPYRIKGAGGNASKQLLARCGGNSLRTWGVDAGTQALLDEAAQLGLTVALGIWLGHERHGFDYGDERRVKQQLETARRAVERYKDHPALLMWGIGNEMEGRDGDNPAAYRAVQEIAMMVRRLDPDHPTMTAIAEIGGPKVANVHQYCPDIDILGINTYAGAASIPERYREAGGTKPYVATEFGPPGPWEVGRNELDTIDEPSSSEKAEWYRRAYLAFEADRQLCLGSYAFMWGSKQEATPTWFGMFLPDGARTRVVDTMAELWSGRAPADLSPSIERLSIDRNDNLKPGDTVKATLAASDPEGDPLTVEWRLCLHAGGHVTGGDLQNAPLSFREAVVRSDAESAEIKIPGSGGLYRLFAFVHDGKGGGAVANVPLRVEGPEITLPPPPGRKVGLPLVVGGDGGTAPFAPSGWMGNSVAVTMDAACEIEPHGGKTCLQFTYGEPDGWAGVVWQDPPDDWGEKPGGYYLVGATKLTFWARGQDAGENVNFGFGLLGRDKRYYDTGQAEINVTLTKEWQQYTIDLTGKDLSRIKSGFYWSLAGQGKPVTFYLDDIRYE